MSNLPRPEMMPPFSYQSGVVPPQYHCGKCGVHGVKLWREHNTFLSHQSLLCAACACQEQGQKGKVYEITERADRPGKIYVNGFGDQIGARIPAVPTEDGSTYYGYSSVPGDGCAWWYRLPLKLA